MRVLVCGGRNFGDAKQLLRVLDHEHAERGFTLLFSGGADGADSLALDWALLRGVEYKAYFADWRKHGRAAGPIRNQQMLDEGKPDLVITFPGGRGTADMVRRAKAAGVEVLESEP